MSSRIDGEVALSDVQTMSRNATSNWPKALRDQMTVAKESKIHGGKWMNLNTDCIFFNTLSLIHFLTPQFLLSKLDLTITKLTTLLSIFFTSIS